MNKLFVLENEVFPKIWRKTPDKSRKRVGWQQDGAPCHTTHRVADLLEKNFGKRVISRSYPKWKNKGVNWSGNSPDLTPLDVYLNPELRKKIFEKSPPKTMEELKRKASRILNNWDQKSLKTAIFSIVSRSLQCAAQNGGYFEHLR